MSLDITTGVAIALGGIPLPLCGTEKLRTMKTEEAQLRFMESRARDFLIFGAMQMGCGMAICAVAITRASVGLSPN